MAKKRERKAYKNKWNEENRERLREYHKAWRQKNQDKVQEYKRREREKQAKEPTGQD
mgnify:CR=1 FL=1